MKKIKVKMKKKLKSIYKAYFFWHKISKKYINSMFILIPRTNREEHYWAFYFLDEFLQRNHYANAVVLTNLMKDEIQDLNNCERIIKIELIDDSLVNSFLQFYSLYNFSNNFLIASKSLPKYRCLGKDGLAEDILLSDFFELAIYKIKPFSEEIENEFKRAECING